MINSMLVLWSGGWRERIDYTSISAHIRVEGLLSIGAIQSPQEADRIADAQLAIFSNPRTEITVSIDPVSENDSPYLGYGIGDTISVGDDIERIIGINITEDDSGIVTFVLQLRDRILDEQDRLNLAVKKMSNGTLGGSSSVATPASLVNIPTGTSNCCPPQPGGVVVL